MPSWRIEMNQQPYWGNYGAKKRIEADGIRAKSRRGSIGGSWWSKRFTDSIEGMGLGVRLTRGRTYARQGQVLEINIKSGLVEARVQGSRRRPYRVEIGISAFSDEQWAAVEAQMAVRAVFAAKLLGGEMPDDIENVFEEQGLGLLPRNYGDLPSHCSCPDWSDPCKHIAACLYLLAEQFDDDPFLILEWRGRPREVLLANLSAARSGGGVGADTDTRRVPRFLADLELSELRADPTRFYQVGRGFDEVSVNPSAAKNRSGEVSQDLTPIARTTVGELLGPLYEHFTAAAVALSLSDTWSSAEDEGGRS
jgi:uncharacterized Zn finger protein